MRRDLLVVAAILMDKQGRVLLVANDWSRRGKWRYTLPGGMVENGEVMLDAVVREVREETGLRVKAIQHLAYVVQIEDAKRNERTIAMAFRAEYDGLLNPRDPDGHIVEARFFTPEEVLQKLDEHQPLLEPLSDYLKGERGHFYCYAGWGGEGRKI
ncbi:MAG: NUDIX hydrolase [Meiothermus sp.]|nr:NUDIX hydrolase [Meiothermus sp.]